MDNLVLPAILFAAFALMTGAIVVMRKIDAQEREKAPPPPEARKPRRFR